MLNTKTKNGLRVRPSYEQLMNTILEGDIIRPKKPINVFDANWLMSTPQMTQLRKDAFLEIQNLQMKMEKQQLLDMTAKKIARETGKDIREAREEVKTPTTKPEYYDISDGKKVDETMDDAYDEMVIEDAERKRKEEEKASSAVKRVKASLEGTVPNTMAHQMASASSSSQPDPMEIEEKRIRPGRPKISKGRNLDKQTKQEIKSIISKVKPPVIIEEDGEESKIEVKEGSKKGTIKEPLKKSSKEEKKEQAIKKLEQELRKINATKAKIKRQEDRKQKQESQQNPTIADVLEKTEKKTNKEKRQEKKEQRKLLALKEGEKQQASSSSNESPTKQHGVKVDTDKNRNHWKTKPIAYLKTQAELMGYNFTEAEIKGTKKMVKGKIEKTKKFTKDDYLNVIYKLLKI